MPVYNSQNYIKESIESVINQTFDDFELICIDDGSSDRSADIINEFSRNDSRIKLIYQKNIGSGASRNNGLKASLGEYVFFMDSDDYIVSDFLQLAYDNITKNDSDMVMFKIGNIKNEKRIQKRPYLPFDKLLGDVDFDNYTFDYKSVPKYVLNASFAAWMKFYKKEFLDLYDDFLFDEELPYEDILFHVKSMLRASKISFIPEYLYYYRLDSVDSCTSNDETHKYIFDVIEVVEEFLRDENYFEEFEKEFEFFKITQTINHVSDTDKSDFNKSKSYIKDIDFENNEKIPLKLKKRYEVFFNSDCPETYKKDINIHLLTEKQMSLQKSNEKLTLKNNELEKIKVREIRKKEKLESSKLWRITRHFK